MGDLIKIGKAHSLVFECSFSDDSAIQATTKELGILSHQLTGLGYLV